MRGLVTLHPRKGARADRRDSNHPKHRGERISQPLPPQLPAARCIDERHDLGRELRTIGRPQRLRLGERQARREQ
jgi:hypothetical protein